MASASASSRTRGRQELNGPSGDDDVLTLNHAATRSEVVENATQREQNLSWLLGNYDKDVYVHCGYRFEIESRPDCAADGVAFHDSVSFHLIDEANDLGDTHATFLPVRAAETRTDAIWRSGALLPLLWTLDRMSREGFEPSTDGLKGRGRLSIACTWALIWPNPYAYYGEAFRILYCIR